MTADTPARTEHAATTPHGVPEGVALAHAARDGGPAAPFLDWLAGNPDGAAEVARYLAAERDIGDLIADPTRRAAGGYEIRGVLGRGGMGVVYRAYDPHLRREVAVKQVICGDAERFRIEAEAAAGLDHPHVVPVYAFGEDGGVPYLVMPVMAGGSLAARLKALGPDQRLPARETAALVRDVARGVHHAHQRGLLHRDLKPANVLLDADGRPHVADFGLARPLGASLSTVAGTAAYMAPEQACGDTKLTAAADIHALGAILFELLVGRPPFGAEDVGEVIRRVVEEPAPPVRRDRPDCPPDLEAVCARCLEKRPDDRYPSAAALADDLDRFLSGEPVGRQRPGVLSYVTRLLRRRRVTDEMRSWPGAFIGAASTFLALAVIQAAVLLDASPWVAWAGLGYYVAAWAAVLWLALVRRRAVLNAIERASAPLLIGMAVAAAALIPAQLWQHGGRVPPVFQPMLVVIGLATFGQGVYWGRLYVAGLGLMAAGAALPLVPERFWPGVHGAILTAFQVWAGYHLRRFDRTARAAPGGTSAP